MKRFALCLLILLMAFFYASDSIGKEAGTAVLVAKSGGEGSAASDTSSEAKDAGEDAAAQAVGSGIGNGKSLLIGAGVAAIIAIIIGASGGGGDGGPVPPIVHPCHP